MSAVLIGLITVAVWVTVLFVLVLARKKSRDRRESWTLTRKQRYEAALRAGGTPLLAVLADVRNLRAQVDLAAAIGFADGAGMTPEARLDLQQAADTSGLARRLEQARDSRSAIRRGMAALLLSRLQMPSNVETLAPLLRDCDPDVRRVACAGLAVTRDPRSVPVLVDAVADRVLAPERMIEQLAQPWAVPGLMECLDALDARPERRAVPRSSIARALGLASDARAAPALEHMLEHGALEERVSAARALGTAGTQESCPHLKRALADPAWELRAQAARALGELHAVDAIPMLGDALSDSAWWVRRNAGTALRRLGPEGMDVLQAALDHADAYARDRAQEELAIAGLLATGSRATR